MDKISRERRSYNMSRIRSADTSVELKLRKALWSAGVSGYRVHPKSVHGKPDIAFTRWRLAVFVDGCFWHSCPECFLAPSSNRDYWGPKIARNVERDRQVSRRLEECGWRVLRIWEHEIKRDASHVVREVTDVLVALGWRST